jgi:RNA polymerase sigma-70 factor, ECF subfamily
MARLSFEAHHDTGEVRKMGTSTATTEQIWDAFHTPLQQFIRRRVPDDPTAEDLLQEVFLKIHQHISALKDARQLESWLYRLTRNIIIDYYRSQRQTETLESAGELALPQELPDEDIVSELLPSVRAMVYNLPPQDRQALILTEYRGLTQKELSERLGISLSGAKSRVQRARQRLKQQLLDCCHFELDRRGHVLEYQPRCASCVEDPCCAPSPSVERRSAVSLRPFPRSFVSIAAKTRTRGTLGSQIEASHENEAQGTN